MKSMKTIVVMALVMTVAAMSFAWAVDEDAAPPAERRARYERRGGVELPDVDREALKKMTPEERREFMRKRFENMTPEQREELRKRRQQGGDKGRPGGMAGSFIERWLRHNPEFQETMKAQRESMKKIGQDLRALHEATRKKLHDKELTPEQRQRIIEDAKTQARALMGQILDGRIRFQKFVTKLIEEHREEILDEAGNVIFRPRRRKRGDDAAGQRPGQDGDLDRPGPERKRRTRRPDDAG